LLANFADVNHLAKAVFFQKIINRFQFLADIRTVVEQFNIF